jgi:hypothetical protein
MPMRMTIGMAIRKKGMRTRGPFESQARNMMNPTAPRMSMRVRMRG